MGRSDNVRDIVAIALESDPDELEEDRIFVAGAVVLREGDHYRIEDPDALLPDPSVLREEMARAGKSRR
jgi:hypothetical protein